MEQEEVRLVPLPQKLPVPKQVGIGILVFVVKDAVADVPLPLQLVPVPHGVEPPGSGVELADPLVGRRRRHQPLFPAKGEDVGEAAGAVDLVAGNAVDGGGKAGKGGLVHGAGHGGEFPPHPVLGPFPLVDEMLQVSRVLGAGVEPAGVQKDQNGLAQDNTFFSFFFLWQKRRREGPPRQPGRDAAPPHRRELAAGRVKAVHIRGLPPACSAGDCPPAADSLRPAPVFTGAGAAASSRRGVCHSAHPTSSVELHWGRGPLTGSAAGRSLPPSGSWRSRRRWSRRRNR